MLRAPFAPARQCQHEYLGARRACECVRVSARVRAASAAYSSTPARVQEKGSTEAASPRDFANEMMKNSVNLTAGKVKRARPAAKSASRSLLRALLTPRVNTGSPLSLQ